MIKKIKVLYTERTDDKERLKRIIKILWEEVYACLKKSGRRLNEAL